LNSCGVRPQGKRTDEHKQLTSIALAPIAKEGGKFELFHVTTRHKIAEIIFVTSSFTLNIKALSA
jgi:hypothetical protein